MRSSLQERKRITLKFSVFLLFIFYVSACRTETVAPVNQNIVNQSVVSTSNFSNAEKTKVENPSTKGVSSGEITNCAPEKFARGAKLAISLKNSNGGYLAIEREGKKPDYFLLSDEENSELQKLATTADALPFWTTTTLKTLKRIELDSTEARAVSLSKLDKQGKGKAELIFSQTGWYKILLSDENFEQDEPVITGQCRVFYEAASAEPQNAPKTQNTFEKNLIKWNSKTKSQSFETQLELENDQPTAFRINGTRTVMRGGEESANECSFAVEKGENNSIWQTEGNKTAISGKTDSGADFRMFIEKTGKGFQRCEHRFDVAFRDVFVVYKIVEIFRGVFRRRETGLRGVGVAPCFV